VLGRYRAPVSAQNASGATLTVTAAPARAP